MKTIHELRTELEQAQAAYLAADIEHPTAVSIAKDELSNARFDYWAACADLVTRLPVLISNSIGSGDESEFTDLFQEITGKEL